MTVEHQPCGTWAAYKRHLTAGEVPDEACTEGARRYKRAQLARTVRARELQDYLFRQLISLIAGACREEGMLP